MPENLADLFTIKGISLFFGSGFSFFVGMGLIALFCLFVLLRFSTILVALGRIMAIAGFSLVLLSSVAAPVWEYAALLFCAAIVFVAKWESGLSGFWRYLGLIGCVGLASWMSARQWDYEYQKIEPFENINTIIVLGDSLATVKLKEDAQTWPEIIDSERGNLRVINASSPAMRAQEALLKLSQKHKIKGENTLVLIVIGAYDFASSTSASEYKSALKTLLDLSKQREYSIALLQPPLPPLSNHFDAALRSIADEYDIRILPRHYYSKVLAQPESTPQKSGLTLTPKGHERFAEMIQNTLLAQPLPSER